ncbi:MAG: outer membrane protein [Myxococcaceae bacterium]|nr:outer membrane protein [Myxococcaceae bacterium]
MARLSWKPSLGAVCFAALAFGPGCAHDPPKELVDARAAYRQAASGVAATESPAQLHTANNALQLAEQTFKDKGDDEHTRDLSYVAMRKAQLAEVQGRLLQDENRLKALEAQQQQHQGQELSSLRGQYQTQQQQLAAAEAARKESEARAAQAAAELAKIASVKQEDRGMVITLSGEVLFTSGKAVLLPAAQRKLDEVASALTKQSPNAQIVVEGHTDAKGSEPFNLDLSTRRAQAVREYLAAHGVAPDRIRAEGLGFSRPVADNKTAEGRANNRRVEIVVQPTSGSGAGPQG